MKFLNLLTEAGISFGGKTYPKSDNVVILAGGAGSGKGFVLSNLLLINGKVFDVDKLKTEIISVSKLSNNKELKSKKWLKELGSSEIDNKFKQFLSQWKYGLNKETDDAIKDIIKNGKKVGELELKNPIYTGILHLFSDYLGIDTTMKQGFFDNLAQNQSLVKPNVIFDVTLKDTKALAKIYKLIQHAGYSPLNTHLVWILNDIEVAKQQNSKRSRKVDEIILNKTHVGASKTMSTIVNKFDSVIDGLDGVKISDMIQGDIWIIPNKEKVDSVVVTKKIPYDENLFKYQGIRQYVKKYDKEGNPIDVESLISVKSFDKYQIKERGKPIKTLKQIEDEGTYIFNKFDLKDDDRTKFVRKNDIVQKINSYVPSNSKWS